jgi:hypothetical protein
MTEHPASEALRSRSPEMLRQALTAALWDGEAEWLADSRDLMVVLAPYHDCARRLGADVANMFRDAAGDGPEGLRQVVIAFGEREDITPAGFGFTVVEGPDGPSYRFVAS